MTLRVILPDEHDPCELEFADFAAFSAWLWSLGHGIREDDLALIASKAALFRDLQRPGEGELNLGLPRARGGRVLRIMRWN